MHRLESYGLCSDLRSAMFVDEYEQVCQPLCANLLIYEKDGSNSTNRLGLSNEQYMYM